MGDVLSVGLTGGIASGKSAVSARMAERGAAVIDADLLARQVLEPGSEGLAEVVRAFGGGVLHPDGSLNRPELGRIVFADDDARERLNAIVHPRVRAQAARLRQAAAADAGAGGAVVVEDIPLLVETGQQDRFDVVVVVQAPAETRIRRMMERRGMSRQEAESRIASQATDAERAAVADVLLENSGTLEELQARVDELMVNLHQRLRREE
ncbi:dephospho-CoA kinase [Nesterenkonia flava]|uniref:Dephospho-CoA kinase n=1 Tax=Nesterenkonia flava TaxID=469799 RepID=A0ABU1FVZ4_9MICC|nr:dephospho-CoA kinase [Nesterenkonia flava]MDR5712650.1 dephospho-CoA kinase [Nesterenkonia flava]